MDLTSLSHSHRDKAMIFKAKAHYDIRSLSAAEYFKEILPDKDIRQLNYGIDLDKYKYSENHRLAFREQYGINEDEVVVSSVGGLTQRKGVKEFFEMANRFPDLRFMWVGGMFYKGQMQNLTRDLPVFREWLTHGVDCLMGTDMDEFESHIRSLSQDISFASELGKHALQSARKHLDIDKTSQSLAKIYN